MPLALLADADDEETQMLSKRVAGMGIAWQLRALRVPAAVLTYEAKFVQSESYPRN